MMDLLAECWVPVGVVAFIGVMVWLRSDGTLPMPAEPIEAEPMTDGELRELVLDSLSDAAESGRAKEFAEMVAVALPVFEARGDAESE